MTPREDDEIDADGNGEATARDDSGESRFNSLLIVDPAGSTLQNYQKRFLYYTDETWADEGENGKGDFALPIPLSSTNSPPSRSGDTSTTTIPTTVGICMDINPYRFIAPYTAYEFARHAISSGAKLIVLSMAWLTLLEPEELSELSSRPDMDTFQYWIKRFWPFVSGDDWDGGEIVIVFANRCGEEEGLEGKDVARYAGTSCVLAIRRPKGTKMTSVVNPELQDLSDTEVAVWDMLGRGEEGMCFADTDSEPKLVFRIKEAGEP
jgi:protein N-terminal amidase